MNQRLQNAYESFDRWCARHDVAYDLCCDEDDLQGYLVPKKYRGLTPEITKFLEHLALREGLFCREQSTRSGTVYALSLRAIAESTLDALIPDSDRSRLARRLDLVFDQSTIGEMQYHSPTTAQRRQYTRPTQTIGFKLAKKLLEDLGFLSTTEVVQEALDGIAADFQPIDVLKQFESALRELGLLDSLKLAKVTNRLSRDKQVLYFYVPDVDGREREVASYELVKLAEGNNMEQAIKDLADMARRRAPGTTDRESQQIKDREQKIREVAKKNSPEAQQLAAQQQASGDMAPAIPVENLSPGLQRLLSGS